MIHVTGDELIAALLKLPDEERARIAQRLLASLPGLDRDELDDEDRARLHAELDLSIADANRGRTQPIESLLDILRK